MEPAVAEPIAQLPMERAVMMRPAPDDGVVYDAADEPDAPANLPVVSYPPYTAAQLREYLRHAMLTISDQPEISLAAASEPGLYALAAALFSLVRNSATRNGDSGGPDGRAVSGLTDAELTYGKLIGEVRRELGWRDCRTMGRDPTGVVRRGRLLQLIGSFTTLSRPGASPLQRRRVSGDCPLCAGEGTLSVFLDGVRWRCFGCGQQGGLPEFAAAMLDSITQPE